MTWGETDVPGNASGLPPQAGRVLSRGSARRLVKLMRGRPGLRLPTRILASRRRTIRQIHWARGILSSALAWTGSRKRRATLSESAVRVVTPVDDLPLSVRPVRNPRAVSVSTRVAPCRLCCLHLLEQVRELSQVVLGSLIPIAPVSDFETVAAPDQHHVLSESNG